MRLLLFAAVALVLAALAFGAWYFLSDDGSTPADPPGLLFRGSFESGGLAPFSGAQCANTGVVGNGSIARGTITVQDETVGEGSWAARIDLPAAAAPQACEALTPRAIGIGTDDYYALMLRLPSPWREPSPAGWGLVLAQLNFQGIWGAPVMLVAHEDRVELVLQSGLCHPVTSTTPGCTYTSGRNGNISPMHAIPAPLALDTWHQLIIHVHWATDDRGLLETWHRPNGTTTWTKTIHHTGHPTLQWTSQTGPTAIAATTTNDKLGAYRGSAEHPLTIWHDAYTRTTTFTTAASTLP